MKQYTLAYVLDGLTEADFQNWKRHPVSKLVRRFLKDRERQVAEHQIGVLRGCEASPDPYKLGQFNGHINALQELAELEFEHIVAFYPPGEEEEGQE